MSPSVFIGMARGSAFALLLLACGVLPNVPVTFLSSASTPTLTATVAPTPRPTIIQPRNVDQLKRVASWRPMYAESLERVVWSPDGRVIAALTSNQRVLLWETTSGRQLDALNGAMNSIAFSPDSRLLAAGAENNAVKVWDVASGRVVNEFAKHSSTVMAVAFSPDGKLLFAGSTYGPQKFWEVASGRETGNLDNEVGGVVLSCAFSPDGRLLAVGTGGSRGGGIELWDVAKLERAGGFIDLRDDKLSLAFSPDGRMLASGSGYSTVKLWDVSSGREIKSFAIKGSGDGISFSYDGQLLAAAAADQSARILDVASGRELRSLAEQVNVYTLAFSPDGRLLAIGLQDGTLTLWGLD